MPKRQHQGSEMDSENLAPQAKRITGLPSDASDEEALHYLEALSSYLGLEDLAQEEPAESPIHAPFINPEETVSMGDVQKQKFVEAVTSTTSRLTFLMAQVARYQGTVMALRDVQVNWNLPEEKRWVELGAWKTVSRHTNQMMSRVANDLKKYKRKQHQESIAPKSASTISLLELYDNVVEEA